MSSPTDKFCLRWNDFESNISSAFKELREDKDFFDVTLACEEEQVQAHKVILAACSPFFKTVLRRNRHEHPLLYLKGVKFQELLAVLNFMYHGEVNVAQEELNSFLTVAEELKVKGLTQNGPSKPQSLPPRAVASSPQPPKRPRPPPPPSVTPSHEVIPVKSEPLAHPTSLAAPDHGAEVNPSMYMEEYAGYDEGGYEDGAGEEVAYEDGAAVHGAQAADGNKAVFEQIKTFMGSAFDEEGKKVIVCKFCGHKSKYATNIRSHIEGKHTEGLVYKCLFCDYSVNTWQTILQHMKRSHNYQTSLQPHLSSLNSVQSQM